MKRVLTAFFCIFSLSKGICKDIVWTFPPTTLSNPSYNASNPQVASDANGNLIGVWLENGFVVSRAKLLNMDWDASVILSSATASSPQVVSDPTGNATAIWIQNGVAMVASKLFNSSWSTPVGLSATGAGDPVIVVSASGDVIAAWTRNSNVETSTKLFGGNWSGVKSINTFNAAHPRIAIGGSNSTESAVIVWNTTSGNLTSIGASTKLVSQNWGSAITVSDQTHNAGYADVAMDGNGNATVVWYRYDVSGNQYSNVVLQAADYIAESSSWNSPVSISSPGLRDPSTLVNRVAYDGTGNAVALWTNSYDNETFNIQAAVKPAQGNWKKPVDIIDSNLFALSADLGVSSLEDALALYMFYNGRTLIVQSTETDTSGFMSNAWSVPILVSSGLTNGYPKIAVKLSNNALYAGTLWTSYNGVNTEIMGSTGIKALPLPPSDLAVSQSVSDFGFYQDYYNTLTWTSSSDPSVVGYLIFRNGFFLEEVPSNILQYIDNNRSQNGSVTYGVASVNNQNDHSQIITVNFP